MTRTTFQQHARIMRKVVNLDHQDGSKIHCAFSDCDREGYQNYLRVQHEHLRRVTIDGKVYTGDRLCEAIDAGMYEGIHRRYIYCSERHMNMDHFGHGPQGVAMQESRGGMYGYLPTGYRGGIL